MSKNDNRYNGGKVIHVASGSAKTSKLYTQKKAKKFDENNRLLKDALLKNDKQKIEVYL